jgi:hypothetical protein
MLSTILLYIGLVTVQVDTADKVQAENDAVYCVVSTNGICEF